MIWVMWFRWQQRPFDFSSLVVAGHWLVWLVGWLVGRGECNMLYTFRGKTFVFAAQKGIGCREGDRTASGVRV